MDHDVEGEAWRFCPDCGVQLPQDARYCPACGRSVRPPVSRRGAGWALATAGAWYSLLVLIMLTANTALALWISPELESFVRDRGYTVLASSPFPPFIFELAILEGSAAVASLYIILAMLVLSLLLLFRDSGSLINELKGRFRPRVSAVYSVATLFAALLLFNLLYYLVLNMQGIEPYSPLSMTDSDRALLFGVLQAVVSEEINDRVILIGIPLMLLVLLGKREGPVLRQLWGGQGIGVAEVVLIVISAAIFAMSHLAGWDEWKLLPTFVTGLALGYLFVRYGLHASIMLHFCFNYLTAASIYTGNIGIQLLIGLMILFSVIIGVPYLIIYAKDAGLHVLRLVRGHIRRSGS